MATFFTSDTHFGHANIIGYCQRPFETVEQMDQAMIASWNAVVGPQDHVYHLGDFAFGHPNAVEHYRHALHGRITLVKGNHDRLSHDRLRRIFDEVVDDMTLHYDQTVIHLVHRPIFEHRADVILNGHVHDRWKFTGKNINVGVDQWEFRPRTLKELVTAAMEARHPA